MDENKKTLREQIEEIKQRKKESMHYASKGIDEYMNYLNSSEGDFLRNNYIIVLNEIKESAAAKNLKSVNLIGLIAYYKPIQSSKQIEVIERRLMESLFIEELAVTNVLDIPREKQNKCIKELLTICDSVLDEQEKEEKELMPSLTSVLPQNHVMANGKTINVLAKISNPCEFGVDVGTKKAPIVTRMALLYDDDNVNITSSKPFTSYDRIVFDSVISLFEGGNTSITPEMVYREMVHDTNTTCIAPQTIQEVRQALDKMSLMRVEIDGSEECKKRGFPEVQWVHEGYLLPLNKDIFKINGIPTKVYTILEEPCLYTYSKLFKQVITVKPEILDIYKVDKDGNLLTSRVSNTSNRILIKSYLIREIEKIKKNYRNPSILFETLHKEAMGDSEPSRVEKKRIRDYVFMCLTSWKATGYIEDYEILKKGNSINRVKIIV